MPTGIVRSVFAAPYPPPGTPWSVVLPDGSRVDGYRDLEEARRAISLAGLRVPPVTVTSPDGSANEFDSLAAARRVRDGVTQPLTKEPA
jgi:hypothetical protein